MRSVTELAGCTSCPPNRRIFCPSFSLSNLRAERRSWGHEPSLRDALGSHVASTHLPTQSGFVRARARCLFVGTRKARGTSTSCAGLAGMPWDTGTHDSESDSPASSKIDSHLQLVFSPISG